MTIWQEASAIPPVPTGSLREYVLAVFRERTGKVYSFAACYLNAYPLEYRDGCPNKNCKGEGCDDGCPTTGWFDETGDEDYSSLYNSLSLERGDKIMGWCEIPQWPDDRGHGETVR
jgi:hypothetical protein